MFEKMLPMILKQLPPEFGFVAKMVSGTDPEKIKGTSDAIHLLGRIMFEHMTKVAGDPNCSVLVIPHENSYFINAVRLNDDKTVTIIASLSASDLAAEIVSKK